MLKRFDRGGNLSDARRSMKPAYTECQHCKGGIEFAKGDVGQPAICPHCGETTVLKRPRTVLIGTVIASIAVALLAVAGLAHYISTVPAFDPSRSYEEIGLESAEKKPPAFDPYGGYKELDQDFNRQQAELRRRLSNRLAAIPVPPEPPPPFDWQSFQRQQAEERYRRDVLAEMRRANSIAELQYYSQPIYFPPTPSPAQEYWQDYVRRQPMDNIANELRLIRQQEEQANFNRMLYRRY